MALVFYHRGHKLRPELQEFRLGIQKAQEAIDNSVGCKYDVFKKHPISVVPSSRLSVRRRKSDWSVAECLAVSSFSPSKLSSKLSNGLAAGQKKVPAKTGKGELSHVMRKQTFSICENKRRRSASQ